MRFTVFIFLFFWLGQNARSQITLQVKINSADSVFLSKKLSIHEATGDSTTLIKNMEALLSSLQSAGYFAASIDSLSTGVLIWQVFIRPGKQFEWLELRRGNLSANWLGESRIHLSNFSGKPVSMSNFYSIKNRLLNSALKNGYPFAAIHLDSFLFAGQSVSASLMMNEGKLYHFDSISVSGDVRISRNFLSSYLGFKKGAIYDESLLKKIPSRLRTLAFLSSEKTPATAFTSNKAILKLWLKKKSASRFDFILGVVPADQITGKLIVTGQGTLALWNSFGHGEQFGIDFDKTGKATTQLRARFSYPYIFSLPFGLDGTFKLFKKDSTYLDLEEEAGMQFLFSGGNYLKAYAKFNSTSLLTIDTNLIMLTRKLPDAVDLRADFFGVEWKMEQLDYRYNPSSGFDFNIRSEAGFRHVIKNEMITAIVDPGEPGFSFASLYDSVEKTSTQWKIQATGNYFFPLQNHLVLHAGYHGGMLVSESVFRNEVFRIGGYNILRGFDEESVFAEQYQIGTGEIRYLLSENSFASLFPDYGWVKQWSSGAGVEFNPLGVGAGFSFETKVGIFGLSYAVGKQNGNPVDFRSAKIHFGFLNLF